MVKWKNSHLFKKKKTQQQWDKYVFNLQTGTGVRSRGILSEFTEEQDPKFGNACFPSLPLPGKEVGLFLRGCVSLAPGSPGH